MAAVSGYDGAGCIFKYVKEGSLERKAYQEGWYM
jgi:hypothetical protein